MIVFREGYHQLQNDYESDELLLRIFDWIEGRKNKIKWKQPKPFEKQAILSRQKLWIKLGLVIGFLLSMVVLVAKLRKCWAKMGKV